MTDSTLLAEIKDRILVARDDYNLERSWSGKLLALAEALDEVYGMIIDAEEGCPDTAVGTSE